MEVIISVAKVLIRIVQVTEHSLIVDFQDGRSLHLPLEWFPRLQEASPSGRNSWKLIEDGTVIRWSQLGQDLSAQSLLSMTGPVLTKTKESPSGLRNHIANIRSIPEIDYTWTTGDVEYRGTTFEACDGLGEELFEVVYDHSTEQKQVLFYPTKEPYKLSIPQLQHLLEHVVPDVYKCEFEDEED